MHGVDGGGGGLDEGAAATLLDLPPLQRVKQRAHRVSEKMKTWNNKNLLLVKFRI